MNIFERLYLPQPRRVVLRTMIIIVDIPTREITDYQSQYNASYSPVTAGLKASLSYK